MFLSICSFVTKFHSSNHYNINVDSGTKTKGDMLTILHDYCVICNSCSGEDDVTLMNSMEHPEASGQLQTFSRSSQ